MDTLEQLRKGELAGRKRLDLAADLTEFPAEIFDLADSLEVLNLVGNRLTTLPDDLPRLRHLKIIFCSGNPFDHLPAVLGQCGSLEMIGFKSCQISRIPETSLPPRLRWLVLTDNQIEELPASIGNCTRMRKLMLAGNRLKNLPGEMANCRNIELLRLSANRFTSFPDWLFSLLRLAWLALGGNPWHESPDESGSATIEWGDLQIEHPLGEGASGVIFQAREAKSGTIAVKIYKGEMTSDGLPDVEMAVSLLAGAHDHLLGSLARITNHPTGKQALAMPLVDPGYRNLADPPDLQSCSRDIYDTNRRYTAQEVRKILRAMADAGSHLHQRGILHGDFYAHNILINDEAESLLGDFGAASHYPQGHRVEKIEVRAFGCLMEELLAVCDGGAGTSRIRKLMEQCLDPEVGQRPTFTEIKNRLARM